MRLWILRPKDRPYDDLSYNPWDYHWDSAYGFIVRAETEEDARLIVSTSNERGAEDHFSPRVTSVWSSREFTTCDPIENDGAPAIIMRDFVNS